MTGRSSRWTSRALACALALGAGGCGSFVARAFSTRDHGYRGPFRGVALDLDVLGVAPVGGAAVLLYGPFILLDLPLTFVLDLLLLPWDAYHATPHRPAVPDPPSKAPPRAPAPLAAPPPAAPPPVPPPPVPPAAQPREEVLAPEELRWPGHEALWSTLFGAERSGDASESPLARPDVAAAVSTSGGLRVAGLGGLHQRTVAGAPAPATVAAAIGVRGDALVGHGHRVLEVRPRPLDVLPEPPRELAAGPGRWLSVARARTDRAISGRRGLTLLHEPARPATPDLPARPAAARRLAGGPDRAVAAAITAGGERAAVGSTSGEVVVWDLGSPWRDDDAPGGAPRRHLLRSGGRAWATCLAFEGDELLWVGHADGGVARWRLPPSDAAGGVPAVLWTAHDLGGVLALVVGPDGTAVTAGTSDRVTLRRADGAALSLRVEGLGAPGAPVVALSLAADGRELLVGSLDGLVRHLDLNTRELLHTIDLRPLDDRPRAVALLADGAIAVVTARGTLLRFVRE